MNHLLSIKSTEMALIGNLLDKPVTISTDTQAMQRNIKFKFNSSIMPMNINSRIEIF